MIEIGKMNRLKALREEDFGTFFDGGDLGRILLPRRHMLRNYDPGERVNLFIYRDSEDRLIATTDTPHAMVGEFAYLKVVSVAAAGAFLDWGLPKDLLLPFREQKTRPKPGDSLVVYIYLDAKTDRLVASSHLEKFMSKSPPILKAGDKVNILLVEEAEIGFRAIVKHQYWGMLYSSELFSPVSVGMSMPAFVTKVRADGKLDLNLQQPGYQKIEGLSAEILDSLDANKGSLPLGDKSSPEDIRGYFPVSKKTFKKAIGALYKQRLITISDTEIRKK